MELYTRSYLDKNRGTPINGAVVTVYTTIGTTAAIFDYQGNAQINPFLTGLNRSEGEIEFAAADGLYDLKIESGGETEWIRSQGLFDSDGGGAATGGDYYIDSGTANNYVLTPTGAAPIAYTDGMLIRFLPTNTSTGGSTVNVAGLGSKDIRTKGDNAIAPLAINTKETVVAQYNDALGKFLALKLYLPAAYADSPDNGTAPNDVLTQLNFTNISGDTELWDAANSRFDPNGACSLSVYAGIRWGSNPNGYRELQADIVSAGFGISRTVPVPGTSTYLVASNADAESGTGVYARSMVRQSSGTTLNISSTDVNNFLAIIIHDWI